MSTGSGPGGEPGLTTDPDDVEPGRMDGEDAPPAANQRRTEPIPPSGGHDVATDDEQRPDEGAGTSTGPGPRLGTDAAVGGSSSYSSGAGGSSSSSVSPEGQRPADARPSPAGAGDVAQGPHDPGRVESDLPGTASRDPGVPGSAPEPFAADTAEGAARTNAAVAPGGTEESGEVHEVAVPGDVSAEGTSESMEPVDGVRVTAIAPEGHADGEYDNRVPPTTTF